MLTTPGEAAFEAGEQVRQLALLLAQAGLPAAAAPPAPRPGAGHRAGAPRSATAQRARPMARPAASSAPPNTRPAAGLPLEARASSSDEEPGGAPPSVAPSPLWACAFTREGV